MALSLAMFLIGYLLARWRASKAVEQSQASSLKPQASSLKPQASSCERAFPLLLWLLLLWLLLLWLLLAACSLQLAAALQILQRAFTGDVLDWLPACPLAGE